jgi:hypothetical protein
MHLSSFHSIAKKTKVLKLRKMVLLATETIKENLQSYQNLLQKEIKMNKITEQQIANAGHQQQK